LLFDARISLLADAERPLAHNTEVEVYSGSQEIPARVRLLDVEELQPGQSAWTQLRLSRPGVVARRDRFILRIPSPSTTIGGGEVIDVQPRYHRRFQAPVLEALERLSHGSPEELVLAALDRRHTTAKTPSTSTKLARGLIGYELTDIVKQCNLSEDVTQQTLATLLIEGRVRKVGPFWFAQHMWDALVEEAIHLVNEQHRQYPLRSGLSKEEWRTRLNFSSKMATEVFTVLQTEGQLEVVPNIPGGSYLAGTQPSVQGGGLIRVPNFTPSFTMAQQQLVERLLQRFHESPYTPPGRTEAEQMVGAELVAALIEQGQLIKLGEGVLFLRETYEEALTKLVGYLRTHGTMTAAEARDVLGATRKYVLPLLEHMDVLRITRRIGDARVLGPGADMVLPER
jgi:selenocysteine-specific elongation factor